MTTMRITQADIDLAKLLRRISDKLGEPLEPEIQALADAMPTPLRGAPEVRVHQPGS